MTLHFTIGAGGTIKIVQAGASGAIEASYESPSECPSSRVEYDGDVWECEDGIVGQNCNPKAQKVPVKKFRATGGSPCPPTSIVQLTLDFITNLGAFPTCADLAEVDLGVNSIIWSASASLCDSHEMAPTEAILSEGASFVSGSSTNEVTYTLPLAPDDGAPDGWQVLTDYLQSGDAASQPWPVAEILAAHPSISGLEDLQVVSHITWADVPGYGELSNEYAAFGEFRADGSFAIIHADSGLDADGLEVPYVEQWTRDDTGLFLYIQGNASGLMFPEAGGLAAQKVAHRVPIHEATRRWLENPFRLSVCPAAQYTVSDQGDGLVEVTQTFAGDAPLVGATQVLLVDVSGATPRPLLAESFDLAGQPVERVTYGGYDVVADGAERPTHVVIESLEPGTGVAAATFQLTFAGGEPADVSLPIPRPRPAAGRWMVRRD